MKFFTITFWICAITITGYILFYITFQVEALEAQLTKLNHQIIIEQETIHVLKAEWSYLKRPERLKKLSMQILPQLQEILTEQIGHISDIPLRSLDNNMPNNNLTMVTLQ